MQRNTKATWEKECATSHWPDLKIQHAQDFWTPQRWRDVKYHPREFRLLPPTGGKAIISTDFDDVRRKRAYGEQEWTYDTPMREMLFHLQLILTFFHGSQLPPFILLYLHLGSQTYKFMIAELRDLLKLELQQELTKLELMNLQTGKTCWCNAICCVIQCRRRIMQVSLCTVEKI